MFADSSSESITESTFQSYYQHLKLTFIMFVMKIIGSTVEILESTGKKKIKLPTIPNITSVYHFVINAFTFFSIPLYILYIENTFTM